MRILFLINNLSIGGAEVHTVQLSRELTHLGHQVCICYFSKVNSFQKVLENAGVLSVCVNPRPDYYKPWTFSIAAKQVIALCDQFKPDLIHSHLELADVLGQKVAIKKRIPHVITIHNTHWWNIHNLAALWRTRYRKYWLEKGNPLFIAVSRECARTLIKNTRARNDSIEVIHIGIKLEDYGPSKWQQEDYAPKDIKLLCIGRLDWIKGQDELINAMAMPELSSLPVTLKIIGDGTFRRYLENLVKTLKLQNKVLFLGTRKDIPDQLRDSDLYIQPSRSEGMGISLVEALASGLPVVVTNVPSMIEVLNTEPGLGSIVPKDNPKKLAEAISKLIDNPTECRKQAILGLKSSKSFELQASVTKIVELYTYACSRDIIRQY